MGAVVGPRVKATGATPGFDIYTSHRGANNAYGFFGLMADEQAIQNLGQGSAMQAAMAAVMPLAAEPPQVTVTTPIAAIGLDLE